MPNSGPPTDADFAEMQRAGGLVFPDGPTHYIVLDFETSGFKANGSVPSDAYCHQPGSQHADCLLEVGFVVLDAKTLETVDEGWQAIVPAGVESVSEFDEWREQLKANDSYVFDMHTKNGLFDFIRAHVASAASKPEEVRSTHQNTEQMLLKRFAKLLPEGVRIEDVNAGNSPLVFTGNSIANLDIPMMRLWMPKLHNMFSYRIMDVSVLRMFYNDVAKVALPDGLNEYIKSGGGKEAVHRAFDDARHCAHAYRRLVGYARDVAKDAASYQREGGWRE